MGARVPGLKVYVVSLLVIALAVSLGWWASAQRPNTGPALTSALDVLPARTNVVGFTDWARIRESLDLGAIATAGERDELVNEASNRDLSTRSVIAGGAPEMDELLGWSVADAEWEVYGQHPRGAAAVVRLAGSVSFDDLRSRLRAAEYTQDGPIWSATGRTGLPDTLPNVALVPNERLVVMSDSPGQIPPVLAVIDGTARSLGGTPAAAATAEALAGSDSVILQGETLGCDTSGVGVDPDVQQQARTAVERAGGLEPYRYSGRGIVDRGGLGFSAQRLVFAMTFSSAVVASEQADVREQLAAGPFIGRFGQIEETLRLRTATTDDSTLRMAFDHDPETDVFMTGMGPLLFATC